ncbi:hypothetical protein EDC01DRAFT_187798 [Geopyxis carbonaria]|nr:hypothetical protein EDC01DRAFT_187798 [Geopyxis carbonaria]
MSAPGLSYLSSPRFLPPSSTTLSSAIHAILVATISLSNLHTELATLSPHHPLLPRLAAAHRELAPQMRRLQAWVLEYEYWTTRWRMDPARMAAGLEECRMWEQRGKSGWVQEVAGEARGVVEGLKKGREVPVEGEGETQGSGQDEAGGTQAGHKVGEGAALAVVKGAKTGVPIVEEQEL